jgi:hypothetical protein
VQGIVLPSQRVVVDIFADAVQFGFIADDVFPIIPLPQSAENAFVVVVSGPRQTKMDT